MVWLALVRDMRNPDVMVRMRKVMVAAGRESVLMWWPESTGVSRAWGVVILDVCYRACRCFS